MAREWAKTHTYTGCTYDERWYDGKQGLNNGRYGIERVGSGYWVVWSRADQKPMIGPFLSFEVAAACFETVDGS